MDQTGGSLSSFDDSIKRLASSSGMSIASKNVANVKPGGAGSQDFLEGDQTIYLDSSSNKGLPPDSSSVIAKPISFTSTSSIPWVKNNIKKNFSFSSANFHYRIVTIILLRSCFSRNLILNLFWKGFFCNPLTQHISIS